jgi:hypothetical protein
MRVLHRFQFSLRALLLAPVIVLGLMVGSKWLLGPVRHEVNCPSSKLIPWGYWWCPRVGPDQICLMRYEPDRATTVMAYWRGHVFPTAVIVGDDGSIKWHHCRPVNGRRVRRIW